MPEWLKYLLYITFGSGGLCLLIITCIKLRHISNQSKLDRKHEIKKIKLQNKHDINVMELQAILNNKSAIKNINKKYENNPEEKLKKLRGK